MARWAVRVRRAIQAGRPASPAATIVAREVLEPRIAIIGQAGILHGWLPGAIDLCADAPTIIVDIRPGSMPSSELVEAITATLPAARTLPARPSAWVRLADLPGAALTMVDIPADLAARQDVVIVSAPREPVGVARIWLDIVHANTALRARALPRAGVVELAAWLPSVWVIALRDGPTPLVAVTRSAIMAELLSLGVAKLLDTAAGVEAITPWEDPGVQRLFELQLSSDDSGTTIVAVDDAARSSWLIAFAEAIGATIENFERGGDR